MTMRKTGYNKGLPKAGVTSFYVTFVLNGTLVFQMNGSAKMPAFGKPRTVMCNLSRPTN